MISDSIVAHKILLASILVMAASEASARPISVISIGNIPVYSLTPSIQWIETLPANSRMCIESEPITFKGGKFLQLLLEGQKVYTPLPVNRKIFAPDPAGDKSCMSQVASTALPASIPPPAQGAPQPAPNYVAPPTMVASSVASAQTTNDVTSRGGPTTRLYAMKVAAAGVPFYKADDSLIVGITPPLGYFIDPQINPQLVCVMSTVVVHGEKFFEIVMRGNVHVYAPYDEENFAPRPGMDKYCVAPVQQHPLAEKDNRTSVASAQSPEQPPSEANQAKSNVGGTGADAGSLEAGLAAEVRGDWKAALLSLKPLAEQGNPRAQARLGYMYENGEGVPKDYAEAIKWHRKAADQGDADAQARLGYMYDNGEGVPKDNTEAFKWYRAAADQGNAPAQRLLGVMYYDGEGLPKDYSEAMTWFRKAADQGDSDGQNNVGVMYDNGEGVPKDYVEAIKWYRKSANQGNANAQFRLGALLEDFLDKKSLASLGGEVFDRLLSSEQDISLEEQHYAEVMKWFRKSADQGNVDGQYALGHLYYEGRVGVPKDFGEAVKWFRKSADLGYATGQYALGLLYEAGDGVPRDYAEALKWDKKAADQDDVEAQKSFALLTKYRPMLEAKKDVADTVCYPSRCTDSSCVIYGQVENVHDDKIEVRVHVQENGTWISTGLFSGTTIPGQAHDQLNWISYNEVIECH